MRYFLFFIFTVVLFSCSDDSGQSDSFSINLSASKTDVMLNEDITLDVFSNHPIEKIEVENYLLDKNMARFFTSPTLSTKLYLAFGKIGKQTITVVVKDEDGQAIKKSITFNVKKPQDAIKITSIKVNSFKNFGGVFDPEYPVNDINSLADVKFKLSNYNPDLYFGDLYSKVFYVSSIKINQQNLFWDLTNEELYANSNGFNFSLYDDDGFDEPFSLYFDEIINVKLDLYQTDKPTKITLNGFDDFEIEIGLEWPN